MMVKPELTPIQLREYEKRFVPNIDLTSRDKQFIKKLKKIEIQQLSEGVLIEVKDRIGVIHFDSFTLSIRPKLEIINVVHMMMVANGLNHLHRYQSTRYYTFAEDEVSLFDWIALLFTDASAKILKDGLLRGYIIEEDALSVMRGRLKVIDQVRRRYGQIDKLECRYDEHHTNIIENQILHSALALCYRHVSNTSLRRRIKSLLNVFAASSSSMTLNWRDVRATLTYNRLNDRYEDAHKLAWVIFDNLNIGDIATTGETGGFAFLIDMNTLFEKFVEVVVREALKHQPFTVETQVVSHKHIWDIEVDKSYKSLRPDIVVTVATGEARTLSIDVKYKLYDGKDLSSSDIYQTFLYSIAFNTSENRIPTALILYPASIESSSREQLEIRNDKKPRAKLTAYGIDVPQVLRELLSFENRRQLDDVRDLILDSIVSKENLY